MNTCKSVDEQIVSPFEHLIINGSTNDEIKNYFDHFGTATFRKIFTEKDNGIADAFNKGIQKSTGDIILLLNSGDLLYDKNVIRIVLDKFDVGQNLMWLHGKYRYQRSGIWVTIGKPLSPKNYTAECEVFPTKLCMFGKNCMINMVCMIILSK